MQIKNFISSRFSSASNEDVLARSFNLSSWLFVRAIALIYFAAFFSLSGQVVGLVGENGILPVQDFFQNTEYRFGEVAWLRIPSIFWLDSSNSSLVNACYAGMLFSMLLFIGKLQLLSSICLFALYLSLFHVGQLFLSFQWDYLLLEAGFLTILLIWHNNRVVIFLFHWLLFRLRFLSGVSKLQDPSWLNLTTLNYYFETQPLPHLGSWYFHQLPDWILKTGTGFTLFVELVVPFFIFLPRRFRLFAALSTILLQLLIIATSNHNWINLLTIVLCLFLLDDRFLKTFGSFSFVNYRKPNVNAVHSWITAFAGVLVFTTSVAMATHVFFNINVPRVFFWARAWGLGNAYHVFPTMQVERYEFSIEGSADGKEWKQYQFKYKSSRPDEIPPFIVPHQPRLDWMIWFVPPKEIDMKYWFDAFIFGLIQNNPDITGLLKVNPFADGTAPRYVRVLTYRYQFTNFEERKRTGNFWKEEYLGEFPFVPPRRP